VHRTRGRTGICWRDRGRGRPRGPRPGLGARGGRIHLGFHLGLGAFKLAVILEGIHYRHLHGQTVGPGFEQVGDVVQPLLEAGLDSIEERP
jgi:hypothetical protein